MSVILVCVVIHFLNYFQEAIMILQNYIHDFHSLVEWFRLKWEYEHTDPPQRPNFLAWEIRGASPRKVSRFIIFIFIPT